MVGLERTYCHRYGRWYLHFQCVRVTRLAGIRAVVEAIFQLCGRFQILNRLSCCRRLYRVMLLDDNPSLEHLYVLRSEQPIFDCFSALNGINNTIRATDSNTEALNQIAVVLAEGEPTPLASENDIVHIKPSYVEG